MLAILARLRMSLPDTSTKRRRRWRAAILGLVLFVSYGYFYEGGGWNQNTRFDLVRAIVERHSLLIDAYQDNTGDKAQVGNHFVSDKAPGASLTALPAVLLARPILRALGDDLNAPNVIAVESYAATIAAAALPAVIAAVALFLVAARLGATDAAAAFAALACGLGTPLWAYATLFYGHALAGGSLMLAFWAAVSLQDDMLTPRRQYTLGLLVGLAAGWAVVTEYPAIVASAAIALYALWSHRSADRRALARVTGAVAAGAALTAAVLLLYNRAVFGAAFHVSYTNEGAGYDAMRSGIFGVNWPRLSVARDLLFGAYRGLLPLAPILVVAPVGFWFLFRQRKTRPAATVAAVVVIFYFLMTSGYAYWSGGWSYGSRHLGPALAFACLGLAPVWQRAGRILRVTFLVLACVGVGESLVAVATTPQPPADVAAPMHDLLWPAFRSGDFPIGWQSILDLRPPPGPMSQLERHHTPRASWNLGQIIGLESYDSLVPLLAVWLIGICFWALAGSGGASSDRDVDSGERRPRDR